MSNVSANSQPVPPIYQHLELDDQSTKVPRTQQHSYAPIQIDLVTENETDELIIRRFIRPTSYQ